MAGSGDLGLEGHRSAPEGRCRHRSGVVGRTFWRLCSLQKCNRSSHLNRTAGVNGRRARQGESRLKDHAKPISSLLARQAHTDAIVGSDSISTSGKPPPRGQLDHCRFDVWASDLAAGREFLTSRCLRPTDCGQAPPQEPLSILSHASHASLGCTGCTRLRRMRRFNRNPVCGTKFLIFGPI